MARSTVHYADNKTNNILKALHNKLRPAGTPVQRVEYIIELLLLRIFEVKVKRDDEFKPLRKLFNGNNDDHLLFSDLLPLNGNQALITLNQKVFPFYGNILGRAGDVYKNKNLPQKVQDQLVLIEEVFSNSSFTNNVKNGNLNEILGLISDIDEARLLKTDLLGDAIESALSEQGGTKDVGLFRTPDHIRQMMVVMANPSFKDIIFDPACGTGGFLFDAFQYVMEKVGKDEKWPSEKSHKEIREYIKKYIKNIEAEMPSSNIANTFYRVGISGVEYLGMIRKMAAINLYIRGLNPANIEQGDSLDLFDPGVDAGTKSVVIANPPFGAKLDQPAYPKVWEEYPKTDSTTLFVKLMFNHLKNGGRCAVVVSEGFLTWDNEPAKEMRKILIEECNLRAIISLPQGVFVSKNGQGAKTSILYFEKPALSEAEGGGPTKNVWYYKITNDGYSMGVNRKEIAGCQIPEVLELFIKYVKQGKVPPKTKNSFVIPADWIKQIDPRLKLRIITETTEQQKRKFAEKRKKEIEKLDEKLRKEKITEKEYKEKIWQFDNVVENNIQNEIAKRIEKAHSYSFNLQNYRSSLRDEQIKKWQGAFKDIEIKNGSNIEARYQELLQADNKTALQILASFNPESGLEMDIAREYLSKAGKKDNKMQELEDILKEAQKYPFVNLSQLLGSYENTISILDNDIYKQITISNTGEVKLRGEEMGSAIGTKRQNKIDLKNGQLIIYSRLGLHTGSIGLVPEKLDGAVATVDMPIFSFKSEEVIPKYLEFILQSDKFVKTVAEQNPTGAAQKRFHEDKFLQLQIPFPPLEVQREIVEKIERQKGIVEGAEKILENQKITSDLFNYGQKNKIEILGNVCNFIGGSQPPKDDFVYDIKDGYIRLVQIRDFKSDKFKTYVNKESVTKFFNKDDVMIARYGPPIFQILRGLEGAYNVALMKAVPDESKLSKEFLYYFLQNIEIQDFVITNSQRSAGQSGVNTDLLNSYQITLPPLETQKQIVAQLDKEMETLEKVRELKKQAEERINKILEEVWGG
ncbi:MAG: N-6 DNA methylase [Patescibacteria group bacterium]